MVYIDEIIATEVMDSRGNPTVRATVSLSDGTVESAIVPTKEYFRPVTMSTVRSVMHW